MIEEIVHTHMNGCLEEPCYLMRPETNPTGGYVLIEKTGGSERNRISTATFAFQSYGDDLKSAAELNRKVIAAAKSLTTLGSISRSHYSTDYNFTNTATKQPCYQAVFVITYYDEEENNA